MDEQPRFAQNASGYGKVDPVPQVGSTHGAYIVAGHCYGGIVAFEMARQLLTRGEQMGHVVLLEVATPGYPEDSRIRTQQRG
jgi:thioesterase domain-containing protein